MTENKNCVLPMSNYINKSIVFQIIKTMSKAKPIHKKICSRNEADFEIVSTDFLFILQ